MGAIAQAIVDEFAKRVDAIRSIDTDEAGEMCRHLVSAPDDAECFTLPAVAGRAAMFACRKCAEINIALDDFEATFEMTNTIAAALEPAGEVVPP